MKEKVEEVLDTIRPSLIADGGNVELVDVDDEGVVCRPQGRHGTVAVQIVALLDLADKAGKLSLLA